MKLKTTNHYQSHLTGKKMNFLASPIFIMISTKSFIVTLTYLDSTYFILLKLKAFLIATALISFMSNISNILGDNSSFFKREIHDIKKRESDLCEMSLAGKVGQHVLAGSYRSRQFGSLQSTQSHADKLLRADFQVYP